MRVSDAWRFSVLDGIQIFITTCHKNDSFLTLKISFDGAKAKGSFLFVPSAQLGNLVRLFQLRNIRSSSSILCCHKSISHQLIQDCMKVCQILGISLYVECPYYYFVVRITSSGKLYVCRFSSKFTITQSVAPSLVRILCCFDQIL